LKTTIEVIRRHAPTRELTTRIGLLIAGTDAVATLTPPPIIPATIRMAPAIPRTIASDVGIPHPISEGAPEKFLCVPDMMDVSADLDVHSAGWRRN
jgi:hypothetical protein